MLRNADKAFSLTLVSWWWQWHNSRINSVISDFFFTTVCSLGMSLIPQTIRRVDEETDNWVKTSLKIISAAVWVIPPCTSWFYYTGGWNVLCSISKEATQAQHKSVSKYLEPHILGMQARGIPKWSMFRQRGDYGREREEECKNFSWNRGSSTVAEGGGRFDTLFMQPPKWGDFNLLNMK